MNVRKTVHNNVEFVGGEGNNSVCNLCKRVINDCLLFAHSITHKDDAKNNEDQVLNGQMNLSLGNGKMLHKRHKKSNDLAKSLKLANKYLNKINRISLTFRRCVYLQSKKMFRRWTKVSLS